ncbi:MAG TPA: acyl-CoA dehydrogenase family protein, partial [Nitrospiria bacterium]|nr:acyl-CoA dehydrogenase family protein [Nitrospiria bacterium]
GIEKELPLAKQEIEDLANDPAILGGIGKKLDNLVASLEHPDPRRVKKDFTDLMEQVDHRIRKTRVTKYLAANFLKTFYSAGVAGQRRDLNGFSNGLREAQALFASLGKTIQNAATEIPRRTKAHGFFLKQLGHGGISAFALTEPTAGSDSGGVKTTARLIVRPLEALEDGRYRFSLREEPGDSEEDFRYLVDADRIRFTPGDSGLGMAFSPPDSGPNEPGLKIHFDDYNYQNDEGLRYFILDGKNYPFHDIAQVRNQNGVPVYEYYELNGAKMWITNGRVATQFCLYAQSPEGVTGFMVDRHAEGLKIGADERKMGQRGSPTNEIAIDQVRVPRECIIGYEGHGQVNALETLNVGRCGLAVASVFIMRKLIMAAETQAPASDQREAYLSEASAILFGSESATFHLIGLFDHHLTESVRMESAIAKYVTSEDLHEVFALVENALGPSAMTERFGIEKLRRDSRILNIYEGTNEVQRFLVLKDLVSGFTPLKQNRDENPSPEVSPLREFKEKLHGHLEEAIARLGDSIWMDAVLQPTFFPLAEMAGELFRLDCIIYRTRWLEENRLRLGENYLEPLIRLSERAVARCINRLERSDRAYTRNATQWKKNLYHTETTVADSALETPVHPTPMSGVMNREAKGPIRILCILRRVPDPGPEPRLRDDKNAELSLKLNQTDEAALSQLLNFKKTAPRPVELDAVVTGPEAVIPLFQSELGADIDHVFRLEGNNKRVE